MRKLETSNKNRAARFEINDIEQSHIYCYAQMVNFPNDIYVVRAYIGIIVLLHQFGKTSCLR